MNDRSHTAERNAQDLSPSDIAAFFSRQWRFILALTGGVVVLTAVLVFAVLPREYEAAATLMVVSPRFTSEPRPATLTLQAYQQLLESDAAILETKHRLRAEGVLQADDELRLGKELETRIFVPRQSAETRLAPMLQPVAQWPVPEPAEEIANTWAEVFLEQTALLRDSSTESIRSVVKMFEAKNESLRRLEDERVAAANADQQKRNARVARHESRMLAYRNETSELLSAYEAETNRRIESLRSELDLEVSELRLEAMRKAYLETQAELVDVNIRLPREQLKLNALDEQVEANPLKLELRTRGTPAQSKKAARKRSLPEFDMVTEILNPVHLDVAHRRSEAEAEVAGILPRSRRLAEDLTALEQEVNVRAARVGANIASVESLKQQRRDGYLKLRARRNAGREGLERREELEVSAAETMRELRREQLDRRIEVERDLLSKLAQQHNEAVLASTSEEYVRVASPAVAPESPLPRNGSQKLLLAACLGSVVALLVALFRDRLSPARPPAASPGPGTTSAHRVV